MRKNFLFAVVFAVMVGFAPPVWPQPHGSETENPIKAEMRLLDLAFKNLIDAILLNDPSGIEGPFHEVHHAKLKTEKALEGGGITLPKNADKIKSFKEMDEKFHQTLEGILKAAGKKDMEAVRKKTHEALEGCVQCHSMFRK